MPRPRRSTTNRKRVRLTPDVRAQKILDSALTEFSRHGFAATRIEDIARGAGLSKSGFYAHFQSKEEAFEALLTQFLVTGEVIPFGEHDTIADFVDRFVDWCYSRLVEPPRQAMLRLLLAEANRVPGLVVRWRREVATPALRAQQDVLLTALERGQLAQGALTEDFSIAYAPVVYWAISNMLRNDGEDDADKALKRHRDLHRQMMLALLRAPGGRGSPSGS